MNIFYKVIVCVCILGGIHLSASAQDLIPDTNLADAVRAVLEQRSIIVVGDPITEAALADIRFTNLSAFDSGITDLTGLDKATKLTNLDLSENPIEGFSPLSVLTALEQLHLIETGFTEDDFVHLTPLVNLKGLSLNSNELESLAKFSEGLLGMENLGMDSSLNFGRNQISDLTPLNNIPNPEKVNHIALGDNLITDISVLSSFTELTQLHLEGNQIANIEPLMDITTLKWRLHLNNNLIRDLSPLEGLAEIRSLHIYHNCYEDVTPITSLSSLMDLHIDARFEDLFSPDLQLTSYESLPAARCALPKPGPESQLDLEPQPDPESALGVPLRRTYGQKCGLGWAPQSQYQHQEEFPKAMIYALEFEYDPDRRTQYICKAIEIRTGDDAIENLAGWKLYLGTLYNQSQNPLSIPEEHSQVTDRILRITPEMFGFETFPCNTANGPSHPLPGVHYTLKTGENISVDTAYSCFAWGQHAAYTTVDGINVKSKRRITSAALREMETPRLERYILDDTNVHLTYMSIEKFTWNHTVFSDWLLPPSESSAPGAPSALPLKPTMTWGALKNCDVI